VLRISEAAHTAESLHELYAAIHEIVGTLMPARNLYIALYDAEHGEISFPYFVDERDPTPLPKPPGRGLTEYVLRTGEPLLVNPDRMRELCASGAVDLVGADSIDWMGVPLRRGDRTVGVLVVQSYAPGTRYSADELEMLRFVSTQIAMAVERKQAQAAVRDSEERYRRLVELAPDGFFVHVDGVFVFANSAGARLLGARTPDELLGRPILDFVHPDFRGVVASRVRRLDDPGATVPLLAERFVRLDGSTVDVEVQASHMTYEGRPAVQVLARDISERLRAEETLRTQAAALDAAANSIMLMNREGHIVYVNEAICALTGFSRDELIGARPRMLRGEEHDEGFAEQIWTTLRAGRVWRGSISNRRPDGSRYEIEAVITPLRGAGGAIDRFLAVGHDVSERRQAEERLRIQAAALDVAPNAIAIADSSLRIEWVNRAVVDITGYALHEVLGQVPNFLRTDTADDATFDATLAAIRAGTVWRGEVANRRKDGTPYIVDVAVTPVRDARGAIIRFVCVAQDVTEQRRLEEQLRQSQKLEAIGQLAGGVAHDFNNLLTTVMASAAILRDGLPRTAPERADLDAILGAAERGSELTRQLLAFSRRQALAMRTVDLGALVTDTSRMIRRLLPEDVQVALATEAGELLVRADPGAIEQILMNLATNARDAMPAGGELEIRAGRETITEADVRSRGWGRPGAYAVLSVRDTGAGMDLETRRHAFEPFFTTKPVGQGTGLGLASVYGLVTEHDGFVDLQSASGEGTTLRIFFPSVTGAPETEHRVPAPDTNGGDETILVVEDNTALRLTTTRVLQRAGYKVLLAADGREALDLLDRLPAPDLIISDVVMPRVGGAQLLSALRERGATTRMIFTSGYATPDVRERLAQEVDTPFLSKPWTNAELLRAIREVLDR